MEQLQQIKQWFYALPVREQWMVSGTGALIIFTLFFLLVWEPIHLGYKDELQRKQVQQETLTWMQDAALEVRTLRSSGNTGKIRDKNKPVNLVLEQALKNAGLKEAATKIESSGTTGTRVTLKDASFNQVLVWLNTVATHNGIYVVSANMERAEKPGLADARFTFERP